MIASDYSFSLRKRIQLFGDQAAGRRLCMVVVNLGSVAERRIEMANYLHSGPVALH